MCYNGIDYGMGQTNIDHETGIRYGVIPQVDILQAWSDSSEPDYGEPTCPKCGNGAIDIDVDNLEGWTDEGRDYACPHCKLTFWADWAFGDGPIGWNLDDSEYIATQGGDDSDIFVIRSPYYTYGPFCSPCAPGAVYLPNAKGDGARAYCFGPDWFDDDSPCPYPIYRVSDNVCVYTPEVTK